MGATGSRATQQGKVARLLLRLVRGEESSPELFQLTLEGMRALAGVSGARRGWCAWRRVGAAPFSESRVCAACYGVLAIYHGSGISTRTSCACARVTHSACADHKRVTQRNGVIVGYTFPYGATQREQEASIYTKDYCIERTLPRQIQRHRLPLPDRRYPPTSVMGRCGA